MARTEDEREIRLRPPKPRIRRNEGMAWSSAFRLVMRYARSSRKTVNRAAPGGKGESTRPYFQRCAVRVTYLNNKMRGHWKAHGRYLVRESAKSKDAAEGAGFSREGEGTDIATTLARWQAAGDERLWKLIVSPEFGDRIDLPRLTRDLIGQMEQDLGTDLEWLAVEHHNTEHPHVHIVVRGLKTGGESMRFSRGYVQHGIRGIAEDRCTRQIGHRTQQDAEEAERREITESRFTSLDRRLLKDAPEIGSDLDEPEYFAVIRNPVQAGLGETARLHTKHEAARLAFLARMGLAESTEPNTWRVRRDFEQVLRAMQRTTDRQRTLAAHGVVMSDERLPIEVLEPANMASVQGRVLVHGQDEISGRNYLMLEGTGAKVYFVNYTPEMEEARSRGDLRTNSFVCLRKLPVADAVMLDVNDLGDADALLDDTSHFGGAARQLLKRGIMPTEDGWGGWLGKYQATLCKAAREIEERNRGDQAHERPRRRDRSRGR
jgi:type IV secretory pathway VirD2 relaxase